MSLSVGSKLGPYEILAAIGAGGMGEVYKARDTRLNRIVAIKSSKEQFNQRFMREARAVAALNHPNICQLFDIGPDYLVMEFIEGQPIAHIDDTRKLLDLSVQLADGVAYAHQAGVIHRDLKPANVLVTKEGRVKILDFGLAKMASDDDDPDATKTLGPTADGAIIGTIAYMSPEQTQAKPLDFRTDQFSLGLVLYEIATGKRGFARASAAETMAAILRDDVEPMPAGLPTPFRWIVERCLAKEPHDRYASTADLHRDLRQVRDRLSELSVTQSASTINVKPPRKSRAVHLAWAVALIVVLVAALLWPIAPGTAPTAIPFATESSLLAMPSWSPDGDRIAYSGEVNGVLQIFLKKVGTDAPTQITHEAESCFFPFWSGDGTRIYYKIGERPKSILRSIALAGGAAETAFEGVERATLSPDGKTLAVIRAAAPGQYQLAFASPPNAPLKPYTESALPDALVAGNTELAFDPSGETVGFSDIDLDDYWQIPVRGGSPKKSDALGPINGISTVWLDQNRLIVGTGPGTGGLELVDRRNGRRRRIGSLTARDSWPAVSKTGRVAFGSGNYGFDVVRVGLNPGDGIQDVVATPSSEVAPAWAPDGVHFAYATDRSGWREIWLRNRSDGTERLIVGRRDFPEATDLIDLAISPDGTRIAYRVAMPGRVAVWISPLSGDVPTQFWKDPNNAAQRGASWSPDGNWLAFYGVRDGKSVVQKARVGGSTTPQVLATMNRLGPVRWSPRGDWILFRDGDSLKLVSPDGSQTRTISDIRWETYGWDKTGASVIGLRLDAGRQVVGKIDIDSKVETKLADAGPIPASLGMAEAMFELSYRGFSLSADGKSFLTSVFRFNSQIYILDDYDRPVRLLDRFFPQLGGR